MKCDLCGAQAAAIKKTTKSFGRGDYLIVIENIPIVQCSSCHESYLTADTAREIDRIRKNRRSLGKVARSRRIVQEKRSLTSDSSGRHSHACSLCSRCIRASR